MKGEVRRYDLADIHPVPPLIGILPFLSCQPGTNTKFRLTNDGYLKGSMERCAAKRVTLVKKGYFKYLQFWSTIW